MSRSSKCLSLVLFVAATVLSAFAKPWSEPQTHQQGLTVVQISTYGSFCGEPAEMFLKQFCNDPTFKLPYRPIEVPNIQTRFEVIEGKKHENPYLYKAALCCVTRCRHSDYRKLCHFHKNLGSRRA